MMMRLGLMIMLVVLVGCSRSEPPVTPSNEVGAGDVDEAQIPPKEKTPEKVAESEHVPTFSPTKSTPITTTPENPAPESSPSDVRLTEKMKAVVADLISPNPKVKDQAQIDLESTEFKPVEILLAAAKDENAEVRAGAIYGLSGRFNQFNPRMMDVLRESLGDANSKVRSLAISAISEMPPKRLAAALEPLANILNDPSESAHVRAAAARLMGKVSAADLENTAEEEQATLAFQSLQKALLSGSDRSVQLASLVGIVSLASTPTDAVLVLSKVLMDSKDDSLRRRAALQLGDLGEASAAAVPALISTLSASDRRLATTAADALIRIGSPSVPLLGEKAAQGEKPARLLAIGALTQLGPVANSSKIMLEQAAQDSDKEIQSAARVALQAISQ